MVARPVYHAVALILQHLHRLLDEVAAERRGRKPRNQPKTGRPRLYSTPSLLLFRIAADLLGWSLRKTLNYAEQEAGAWLRKALGWEQVPHLSVVCRRLHGDDVRRLRTRLWRKLRRRSLRQGDLRVLTIDMTDLPVPLRRKDPDATWGATSKGKFFGYKLHLVISRTGFPLAFRVTPAAIHEMRPAVSLFAEVVKLADQKQKAELTYGVGDSAYDSENLYKFWADVCCGHFLCAPNRRGTPEGEEVRAQGPYRKAALEFWKTDLARRIYGKHRSLIESVNAQLKDLSNPFQVGQIPGWIRGLRRVSDWVFWRILAFSSILYANRLRGSCSRKLSRFIA